MIDLNQSPYFDDYDSGKEFVKQLAVPERGAQAREYTQLQTMYLDFLKRFGDSLYKDGNVIEGCSLSVRTIDGQLSAVLSRGKIYLNGLVREFKGATLPITGKGEELLGCKIVESIVTEVQDSSLLDPATGQANHLHPGCHRLKQEVIATLNDPLSAQIVRLMDGEPVNITYEKPQLDVINEVLARRTYDESGNYVVDGFSLKDRLLSDDNTVSVTLTQGKAYIRGFEIEKPNDVTFTVNKSSTFRTIEGEPTKASGTTNNYELQHSPVKEVSRVFVTLRKTNEEVVRGALPNTEDALANGLVVSIESVTQNETTYIEGRDYLYTNGKLSWYYSTTESLEPATGTTYKVTYTYKKVLTEGKDYSVLINNDKSYVTITNNTIVTGSEILINYTYYLARKDLVALDSQGNIVVLEGQPDLLENVLPPVLKDDSVLKLGTVLLYPNSEVIEIVNNTTKVSRMDKIQKAIQRIDDLEYNIAISNLDREAIDSTASTQLRGVFTDSFINLDKADMTDVGFKASFDLEEKSLIKPFTDTLYPLSISGVGVNNYGTIGGCLTLPYEDTIVLSQPYATQGHLINPYQVFPVFMDLRITPSVDNWIETQSIVVSNINGKTSSVSKWWVSASDDWIQDDIDRWNQSQVPSTPRGYTDTITGNKTETILDEAILYIRPRTVQVQSNSFPFGVDNVRLRFDGRELPLTPNGTSTSGTTHGSVKADAQGNVSASFIIPEGIPCGTKEVELFCESARGFGQYSANGRKIVTQQTIFVKREVKRPVDPIAQTFQLDDDFILTKANIYVKTKDDFDPITVQIRTTSNGYPTNICLGECVLKPSQIKVSADSSVPTTFTFDTPVRCLKDEQYAIVVMTDSPTAEVFVAKMGEKNILTGDYITTNAYFAGVMFSSSNALTWSAHQDFDLKFDLFRAKFSSEGTITFNQSNVSGADRIMPIMETFAPLDTSLNLQMKLDGGSVSSYTPWVARSLEANVNTIDTTLLMSTKKDNLSPFIVRDACSMIGFKNELTGVYMTKHMNVTPYNSLDIYLDKSSDNGNVKVYINTEGTTTWEELTSDASKDVGFGFTEMHFTKSISSTKTRFRLKIEINTTESYSRLRARRLRCILKNV